MAGTSGHDRATLAFYDREAVDYAARGLTRPSRHLPGFLARLPAGGRILELGCGAGRDTRAMLAAGFVVEPTDASAAMARLATGARVRVMRFEDLAAVAEFDGVFANASLLHVPRAGLPGVLARVHRALRPGGWHLASYKSGSAEGRDRFGRFFNYPDADWLRATYTAAGFRIEAVQAYAGGGYRAAREDWLAITVQR